MEAILDFVSEFVINLGTTVSGAVEPRLWMLASVVYFGLVLVLMLIFDLVGEAASFKRALIKLNKFLKSNVVDGKNADAFGRLIAKCPDSVRMGWNCYKQNKIGYPSEFITEYDCLRVPMIGNKKKNFLTIYVALAASYNIIAFAIMAWSQAPNTMPAISFILLVSIVVYAILVLVLNRGQSKLFRLFRRFLVLVDDKVEIFEEKNTLAFALEAQGVGAKEREQLVKAEELSKFIKKAEVACADSETTKEELKGIKERLITYAVESTDQKATAGIIGAIKSVDGAIATRD